MTAFHFAGLNTAKFAAALEGEAVLISYADVVRRPGVWKSEILPRLQAGAYVRPILDSGAFTELTTPGFHVSVDEYAAFINEFGSLFDQIVTLDDIRGDLARTWRNTARLIELTGAEIIPVFHGREPIAVLHHYCERFERVGLGFARDKGRISPDQGDELSPNEWLAAALDIVEAHGREVHGFGMTRYARELGHDRLTTTDSTTWIAEYCSLRCDRGVEGGRAAALLEGLGDAALTRLAIRSYAATRGACVEPLTDGSKGQARTTLRRFTGAALVSTVAELADSHR